MLNWISVIYDWRDSNRRPPEPESTAEPTVNNFKSRRHHLDLRFHANPTLKTFLISGQSSLPFEHLRNHFSLHHFDLNLLKKKQYLLKSSKTYFCKSDEFQSRIKISLLLLDLFHAFLWFRWPNFFGGETGTKMAGNWEFSETLESKITGCRRCRRRRRRRRCCRKRVCPCGAFVLSRRLWANVVHQKSFVIALKIKISCDIEKLSDQLVSTISQTP